MVYGHLKPPLYKVLRVQKVNQTCGYDHCEQEKGNVEVVRKIVVGERLMTVIHTREVWYNKSLY